MSFNHLINKGFGINRAEGEQALKMAKALGLTPSSTKLEYDLRSRLGQNDDAPAVDVSRLTAEIARETSEHLEPLTLCQFLNFVDASTKTRQYAVIVHIRATSADEATERVGTALFGRGYTWEIAPTETKQE